MTINFVNIRSGLGTWFSSVTGLAPRDRDGPHYWGGTWDSSSYTGAPVSAHGLLHVKVLRSIGRDAILYEYDSEADEGEEMTPYVYGGRELLFEVGVKSFSQAAGADASFFLQKIMDNLSMPAAKAAFKDIQLGYQSVTPIREIPLIEGRRKTSYSVLEITFNATAYVAGTPTTYIDQFEITSEIADPVGDQLPAGQQMDEEQIG